ncbi:MAG: hypothetical protein MI922_13200, partial [Bacteroidales bacterium]|nr:hypothetical protein [Bacteroidales bacterium]
MASDRKIEFMWWFFRIRDMLKSDPKNYQKKIFTFLIFLVLSSIIWMHRTLQEEYIAEVNHPIRFINFPNGKTLTEEPPDKIQLRVRSDGYSILKNKIRFKLPLKFDVSSFSIQRFHSDSTRFYVLTRYAKERLNDELDKKNNALNILEISPDTIYFSLTDLISKKVKVAPSISNLNDFIQIQHKQNGAIMMEPDSVLVSGPAFIVDTLKTIYTKQLDLKMMTDTTAYRVKLSKYDEFSIKEDRVR